MLARHGGSPSDTNGSRPFQFRDTYTKAPQLFQWGLCICISEVVSLPLTEGKGVWELLGPCLRNWASEIFTGVGKVRGRVLMALDAPVVGEEAMWISTSRCRHLSACIVKMRSLFKRSSEPPSFLQAALLEEWFLSSKKDSVEKLGVLAQTTMDQICLMADLIGIACKCQG